MSFTIAGPQLSEAAVCIPIVRSLPEWFGIEEFKQIWDAQNPCLILIKRL